MDNDFYSVLLKKLPEVKKALLDNLAFFAQFPQTPLLKAGDQYQGIWLEHNQDNLFLVDYVPESAWASQRIFMQYQREDGLLPCAMTLGYGKVGHPRCHTPACYAQVQAVYPFARCALEIAKKCKRPEKDFFDIYEASVKYDRWFEKFRIDSETGLPAMFCEFDTGHDNSPRVTDGGIPHCCPERDAVNMPDLPVMPVLSVDFSAMLYGHRIALAELAGMLGRKDEAKKWLQKAEFLRKAMKRHLYDESDDFYYDRSPGGFRKYRTEHITRLFLNKVVDQEEFDRIFDRYFMVENREFATPFPMPSTSADDPSFCYGRKNSWGGNVQCLTLLRALLYLDDYGRTDYKNKILLKYLQTVYEHPDTTFPQELHPFECKPLGDGVNYTPALILFIEAMSTLFQKC